MFKANCNLCLAVNKKTINIMNTNLQTLYEKLANYKVSADLSLWLCYVCHIRMKQCYQLSQLAKQTRCFLKTGLLQTNIKLKSASVGLVNLSLSTTSHFTVPSPNSKSIVEVLIKKEPLNVTENFVFDHEDLELYEDMVNTEDCRSEDSKEYTPEKLTKDNCYTDIRKVACLKNKVEIEINTHGVTNEVRIKEECVDEVKREILEDDRGVDPASTTDNIVYTCNICSHMFTSLSLLTKHKITHRTKKLKDKHCSGRKVVCPICGKYYADRRVLARHKKIHSTVRPFRCEICNKTFSRRDHYNKHAQTHPGFHLYTCHDCGSHFPNSGQLRAHDCARHKYNAGTYSCDICEETFPRWDLYHAHKTDVHGVTLCPEVTVKKVKGSHERQGESEEKRDGTNTNSLKDGPDAKRKKHSCEACDMQFGNSYQLETHILLKHKKTRYECDHCDKVFLRRASMCLHMRTHAGERRYCCDACGKTFTYRSSLNTHRRVHTGDKPYSCDQCGRRFAAFGQLAEHKLVHTDVRAFPCQLCAKSFKRRRHLKKHMMSHTGERPYTCDVCFKSFARNDNFTIHRRIHTGEKPFACDVCGATFSENRHLKKHRSAHDS